MRSRLPAALLGFALGVGVTLLWARPSAPGDAPRAPGRAPAPPDHPAAAEVERLRARLQETEARNEELHARLEALGAVAPAAGPESQQAPRGVAPRDDRAPRFVHAGVEDGLRAADWREAGRSLARLMPLLSEAADVAHGRRPMRAALWGEILQWLGPLVTEAIRLEEAGVPWSSPSVLANLVHATLREAGQPLDAEQEESLFAVSLRFAEEDAARRGSYGASTPRLRQLIDEMRIQDRFFAEVGPLLREAQRAVLYPPGVRGVVGLDVFSGATVWDEKLERLPHAGREALRAAAAKKHAAALELRPELQPHVDAAVVEWERALPDAFVLGEADPGAAANIDMEATARVAFAAERQLALYERILVAAPLLDGERERLLAHEKVLVPMLTR
jgi:hypothetical protein